jgi:hypothetical protein
MVILFDSRAFAKSFEQPLTEPPYGLAIQGDAKGERLIGEVFVENYLTYPGSQYATGLTAVVRLRKGNLIDPLTLNLKTFYKELKCLDTDSGLPCTYSGDTSYDTNKVQDIQTAITEALKNDILDFFFGDTNRSLVLRAADDYGYTFSTDGFSLVGLADIELASKK